MSWTDDRVKLLAKLWADGLSASQIALQLGEGVTRNAVIGKIHRMGLSGRDKTTSTVRKRAPRAASAPRVSRQNGSASKSTALATAAEEKRSIIEESAPEPKKLSLIELTDKDCRWPVGDPTMDDFFFCGCGTHEDSKYCKYHTQIAYQQNTDRRREKRPQPTITTTRASV